MGTIVKDTTVRDTTVKDTIFKDKGATDAPTLFADAGGRRLAYREIGSGSPLILCLRFRGVLDSWDPAFIDALARTFRVVIFDYSGLGQSTGTPSYQAEDMARDVLDLADALSLERFAVGGWSLGGMASQAALVMAPDRITHAVLIGTKPPGAVEFPPEPIFLEHALKPDYDLEDEIVLFFEPASGQSRAAAAASHERIAGRRGDRSPPIAQETYLGLLQDRMDDDRYAASEADRAFLAATDIPILVISGDHEIVFPAGNWFACSREWQSLHLVVLPRMGHGPQHEAPELVADIIASFVRNRTRGL